MRGSAKFRSRRAGARVFLDHVHAIERLADSGLGWAREALAPESPFIFVSAAGFRDSFAEVREEHDDREVFEWTLDDLYPDFG